MELLHLNVGQLQTNCYIVWNETEQLLFGWMRGKKETMEKYKR